MSISTHDHNGRPPLRRGDPSVPVTVLLPESEEARLREEATARGLSLAAVVRDRLGVGWEATATCTLCGGSKEVGGRPCGRCNGHGLLYARPEGM